MLGPYQRDTLNTYHISKKIILLCEARVKSNIFTICKSILALAFVPNAILYLQSQDKALYNPSSFTGLWPIHVTDVFVGEESAETVAKPAPLFYAAGVCEARCIFVAPDCRIPVNLAPVSVTLKSFETSAENGGKGCAFPHARLGARTETSNLLCTDLCKVRVDPSPRCTFAELKTCV